MRHVLQCMTIIDQMEADKKGTSHEKALNTNEKFKLALIYMSMLEKP